MTEAQIELALRESFPMKTYDRDSWNLAMSKCAKSLHKTFSSEARKILKTAKAEVPKQVSGDFSENIMKFMQNPMSPEEEARGLRAMLHAGISTGEIPSNLLAVLEKTIGISSGEDDKVEVVDFGAAFPDLAEAIRVCRMQKPEIKEAE